MRPWMFSPTLECGKPEYAGEKPAALRLPDAEGGRLTLLGGRSIMSMAVAACAWGLELTDSCEVGVDLPVEVPGVRIPEALLVELTDGTRSALKLLPALGPIGWAGGMAARLGGDIGPRAAEARLDELSIRGVRSRAGVGGTKGENACAGLGRFLLEVRGRAIGVVDRASRSISGPPL